MSQSDDSDSDHFRDDEEEEEGQDSKGSNPAKAQDSMDLTGFLFGNVDRNGRLSQDTAEFFDPGSESKMSGLSRLLGGTGPEFLLGEDAAADETKDKVRCSYLELFNE